MWLSIGGVCAMRMNKGVEWAVHACTLLAPLGAGRGLSLAALADYHGVPLPYMAKQMQLLSKAGIVRTSRGKTGGYMLGRPPAEVSLWDIKKAVDGSEPAFRCTEIRQQGPCAAPRMDCKTPCAIAAAFARAETAYREILRGTRLTDLMADVSGHATAQHMADIMGWYQVNVTILPEGAIKAPAP
jgi:Rrf2 family protein